MAEILNFIKKRANYFALILFLIFFLSTFFSVQGKFWEGLKFSGSTLTSDEVSHIPAGFYYLKTRQYFINAEHPPLIKDIAAIPLLFLNLNLPEIPEKQKYENIQWDFAGDFLFRVGNNPDLITFWSRIAIILFNGFLLFLVYFFLKKSFGIFPSLITLFLLVFSPNFIAHSSLVVLDVPFALLSLLSILVFSLFLRDLTKNRKYWKSFILAAIFTSLALLTKFQAIFLLIALFGGGFLYTLFTKKEFWKKYFLFFIFFSILILIFIGVIHGFQAAKMPVEGICHQIGYSYYNFLPRFGRDFLCQLASLNIFFFKGIVEYVVGLFMITSRVIGAWQATYFMGKVHGSEGAGPLYFPILFLTKETLGFLIILLLVILFSIWTFFKNGGLKLKIINFLKNPFNTVCLLFFLIYGLFSLTLKLTIGLRHIFPLIFLLYVLVAKEINRWLTLEISIQKKQIKLSLLFLPLFASILYSWLSVYPYYLSYYNLIGGGTWEGYKIATDSNYDWGGQDVKRLGKWVRDNKIEKIYAHIFSNTPLDYYLGQAYQPFNIRYNPLPPKDSLLAVSAFEMQNINYDKGLPESQKYFQFEDDLIKRVGTTIFIFEIK